MGLVGASGPAHTDMITLTHSQLLPASVHPVPARDVSAIEVKLLNVDELSGSLFNPLHARSRARLLATYLLTYRAPGRREKATYLLFGTTGIELRSSRINQTLAPAGSRCLAARPHALLMAVHEVVGTQHAPAHARLRLAAVLVARTTSCWSAHQIARAEQQ